MNQEYLARFRELFRGFEEAYGIYILDDSLRLKRHKKVKGKAATIKKPVTDQLWLDHLSGKQGLGVIPITAKNTCWFGAIDVDDYSITTGEMARKVFELGLPLIVCETKSGGSHLYAFVNREIPACDMRDKLAEFAAALGVGGSEIFPKQAELLLDRGDLGSWINMPYHGEKRRGYANDGYEYSNVKEFLNSAYELRLTPEEFLTWSIVKKEPLGPDAPPCLNQMCVEGIGEGGRNNALMHAGVYFQKANKDGWERQLDLFNAKQVDPPLPAAELLGVIKSLKRKNYGYLCSQTPMKNFCDKDKCQCVKHGVGHQIMSGLPVMGSLTKIETDPPVWFITTEDGRRIELETRELHSYRLFQIACLEQLNVVVPLLKDVTWHKRVAALLDNVTVVEMPGSSRTEALLLILKEFLFSRVDTTSTGLETVLIGNVYHKDEKYFFRLGDFLRYLTSNRFDDSERSVVVRRLQQLGVEPAPAEYEDLYEINLGKDAHMEGFSRFLNKPTPSVI